MSQDVGFAIPGHAAMKGSEPALLSRPAPLTWRRSAVSNDAHGVITHATDGDKLDANTVRMTQLITGLFASQAVRAFAELAIADELAKGPATAAEVSAAIGTDAGATSRLMRAGIALELVTIDEAGRYSSTALLKTLQRDAPGSMRGFAIFFASPGAWLPWGNFVDAMRTGERQTAPTLGMEYFDYLAKTPAELEFFTAGMDGVSSAIGAQAAKMIDTGSVKVAVDVGGASGNLLHALMAANPDLAGIVFDRPNVVPVAAAAAQKLGLERRLSAVGGDFFECVPEADLYLMKWIMHDWEDSDCIRILTNCRKAMRPGGRVVVIELQLGEGNDPGMPSLMDLNMLVVLNGRERTAHEYGELFAAAGLCLAQTTQLHAPLGPWSLIEGEAA